MLLIIIVAVALLGVAEGQGGSRPPISNSTVFNCRDQLDGSYHLHPSDCTRFIQCTHGMTVEQPCASCEGTGRYCPEGYLHWDGSAPSCVWPDDSSCSHSPTTPTTTTTEIPTTPTTEIPTTTSTTTTTTTEVPTTTTTTTTEKPTTTTTTTTETPTTTTTTTTETPTTTTTEKPTTTTTTTTEKPTTPTITTTERVTRPTRTTTERVTRPTRTTTERVTRPTRTTTQKTTGPTKTTTEEITTTTKSYNFVCPFHYGQFGDPEDCSKYYLCENNIVIGHEDCPTTYLFSNVEKLCVKSKDSDCNI